MANPFFQFKQFIIRQDRTAMKVTTDACLFGAWVADDLSRQDTAPGKMIDIGTGTGLLSLMCAQKNKTTQFDAIEIDSDVCSQANENIFSSPFSDRIRVIHDDARKLDQHHPYDVVISNPPFYEKEIVSSDERKNLALHDAGLTIATLVETIGKILKPKGTFYLLLPYKRHGEIRKMFESGALRISRIVFVRQSTGHGFFRMMIKGELTNNPSKETEIDEISIVNDQQEYTEIFSGLLRDYYLKL